MKNILTNSSQVMQFLHIGGLNRTASEALNAWNQIVSMDSVRIFLTN